MASTGVKMIGLSVETILQFLTDTIQQQHDMCKRKDHIRASYTYVEVICTALGATMHTLGIYFGQKTLTCNCSPFNSED